MTAARQRALAGRAHLWTPVVLVMLAIFMLSAQPQLPLPPGPITDKELHALAFGTLAALWYRALAGGHLGGLTLVRGLAAVAAASAYGASDEVHQLFVPGRTSDLADLAADAIGAIMAVSLVRGCGIIAAHRRTRHTGTAR